MAVIKWYLQVLAVCGIALVGIDGAKSKDEGRPYEFGFTIDGQQHRHERKDANGIIQGEFGFITADGVYHVTTYATDENGAFRILSMRNIKISGPLDGTKAGEYKTKPLPIGQAATQTTQNPKPQQQATQENHPEKIQQSPVVYQVEGTTRKQLVFTTQPTIKPACAGCGYVTRAPTTKKPTQSTDIANIQHLDSGLTKPVSFVAQNKGTQQFNNQEGNNEIVSHQNIQNYPNSVHNSIGDKPYEENKQVGVPNTSISAQNLPGNKPQIPITNQISSNIPNTSAFVENSQNSNVGNQNVNQNNPNPTSPNQNYVGNYPTSSPYIDRNQNINVGNQNINQYDPKPAQPNLNNQNVAGDFPTNKPNDFPAKIPNPTPPNQNYLGNYPTSSSYIDSNQNSNVGNQNINQYDPKPPQPNLNNQNIAGDFPTNKPNDFPVKNPSHSIVDDIKIDNNAIIVPNNPPIPIKDKYPGMVDGLPEGISQTDISDILYKFNYTIGFHGHYEKGLRNGTKIGGYFVNGRDGISRVVTYVADERGFRPKFKLVNLGLDSPLTPKEATEKTFGLQSFEFVWYPLK